MDLDANSKLDYNEFLSAAINKKDLLTNFNLQRSFQIFDLDGDGFIDLHDF